MSRTHVSGKSGHGPTYIYISVCIYIYSQKKIPTIPLGGIYWGNVLGKVSALFNTPPINIRRSMVRSSRAATAAAPKSTHDPVARQQDAQ